LAPLCSQNIRFARDGFCSRLGHSQGTKTIFFFDLCATRSVCLPFLTLFGFYFFAFARTLFVTLAIFFCATHRVFGFTCLSDTQGRKTAFHFGIRNAGRPLGGVAQM
jgi:hypothetical protein